MLPGSLALGEASFGRKMRVENKKIPKSPLTT